MMKFWTLNSYRNERRLRNLEGVNVFFMWTGYKLLGGQRASYDRQNA